MAKEITDAGGTADYVVTDLADAASIHHAVQTVVDRHGRLDIAFNNAGVSISYLPLTDIPEHDFDVLTSVNYKGVWLSMGAEIRAIRSTAGTGAIVNNSSVGSFRGNPGLGAYAAAKRAVNSLTETAAIEYGLEGIRVNAVAPGTTMTAMMQQWASREPDIVAHLNGGRQRFLHFGAISHKQRQVGSICRISDSRTVTQSRKVSPERSFRNESTAFCCPLYPGRTALIIHHSVKEASKLVTEMVGGRQKTKWPRNAGTVVSPHNEA